MHTPVIVFRWFDDESRRAGVKLPKGYAGIIMMSYTINMTLIFLRSEINGIKSTSPRLDGDEKKGTETAPTARGAREREKGNSS